MWLINTKTLRLKKFQDYSAVEYAILSHTWGVDEVSFKDMKHISTAKKKAGFAKISKTCELALKKGLKYAWIDTCCIDKSSSAELSEAINAMFVWYQASAVCFVWLEDLAPSSSAFKTMSNNRKLYDVSQMASCKWFSRGWTLQELIAPANVRFYDANWNFRFTKEYNVSTLSIITQIDENVLRKMKRLKDVLVAVKMSWAANRETTRPEDEAYCLLGIFDINMPMLYGEGDKAFLRLQEQIVNQQEDASVFAWLAPFRPPLATQTFRGIFATSPQQFASSGQISRRVPAGKIGLELNPVGLKFTDVTIHGAPREKHIEIPLHLECLSCDIPHEIFLSLLPTRKGWVRILSESCRRWQGSQDHRQTRGAGSIYCRRVVDQEESEALEAFAPKRIEMLLAVHTVWMAGYPGTIWDVHTKTFCGDALSEDFFGLLSFVPGALKPLRLTLVITKPFDKEIGLRFFHSEPVNSLWVIAGGSREEDVLNEEMWIDGVANDLSRESKAGVSSHLYGEKASVWCEDPGAPIGVVNNAKVEAIVNGLEITISLSMWHTDPGEAGESSICDDIEGSVSHYDSSSQERQTPSPKPDNEWKPRRSKRLEMKK